MDVKQAHAAFASEFPSCLEWFEIEVGDVHLDGHFTLAELRRILELAEAVNTQQGQP